MHGENTAATELALDGDAPAELLDDISGEVKTESNAGRFHLLLFRHVPVSGGRCAAWRALVYGRSVVRRGGSTPAIEFLEDARHVFLTDAASCVCDTNGNLIAVRMRAERD